MLQVGEYRVTDEGVVQPRNHRPESFPHSSRSPRRIRRNALTQTAFGDRVVLTFDFTDAITKQRWGGVIRVGSGSGRETIISRGWHQSEEAEGGHDVIEMRDWAGSADIGAAGDGLVMG